MWGELKGSMVFPNVHKVRWITPHKVIYLGAVCSKCCGMLRSRFRCPIATARRWPIAIVMTRGPILQEVLEVPGQEVFEVAESPRLLEDSGTEQEFLWDAIFQHQRRWQRRHWFRLSSRQNKTCPRKNARLGCRQTVHIESLSRGLYVRVNKTFLRFGWMNVSASILCFGMCLSCCKRSTSLGLLKLCN